MKCPACGAAELLHETHDISYTYKGETSMIPTMTGDYCPACGEAVFDAAKSAQVSAVSLVGLPTNIVLPSISFPINLHRVTTHAQSNFYPGESSQFAIEQLLFCKSR